LLVEGRTREKEGDKFFFRTDSSQYQVLFELDPAVPRGEKTETVGQDDETLHRLASV
jgi:hypothetical protein